MTYDWLKDFADSYALSLRFLALRHGSALFSTIPEMYWLEGRGLVP